MLLSTGGNRMSTYGLPLTRIYLMYISWVATENGKAAQSFCASSTSFSNLTMSSWMKLLYNPMLGLRLTMLASHWLDHSTSNARTKHRISLDIGLTNFEITIDPSPPSDEWFSSTISMLMALLKSRVISTSNRPLTSNYHQGEIEVSTSFSYWISV